MIGEKNETSLFRIIFSFRSDEVSMQIQMETNILQNNTTPKDAVTERNVKQCHDSLRENLNAI